MLPGCAAPAQSHWDGAQSQQWRPLWHPLAAPPLLHPHPGRWGPDWRSPPAHSGPLAPPGAGLLPGPATGSAAVGHRTEPHRVVNMRCHNGPREGTTNTTKHMGLPFHSHTCLVCALTGFFEPPPPTPPPPPASTQMTANLIR